MTTHTPSEDRFTSPETGPTVGSGTAPVGGATATADIAVRTEDVWKIYAQEPEDVEAVRGVSLEIREGDFMTMAGPSGSGKTTLLNLIAGIDTPTAGDLVVDGNDVARLSRARLTKWRSRHVGYIFQLYHLVPILSAFENVELPLLLIPLSRSERRTRVDAALDLVGLADRSHHRPTELSGGQEQRVAIARAIVHDPELLVADEPTGDLDSESAASILDLLASLAKDHGKTIIMVTHDPRAAAKADRTLHLEKGQLIEQSEIALSH